MRFHSLVKLGCCLLIVQAGCASRNADSSVVSSNQVPENRPTAFTANGQLLEIPLLHSPDGSRVPIVLSRREIAAVIVASHVSMLTNGWANVELEKENLFKAWLPTRFDARKNRKFAEIRLAGCTVHKPYSLSELGARDAQELLGKYFEPFRPALEGWWIKKDSPEANRLREADLVATLKKIGFEVARGDIAPFLLVRPK